MVTSIASPDSWLPPIDIDFGEARKTVSIDVTANTRPAIGGVATSPRLAEPSSSIADRVSDDMDFVEAVSVDWDEWDAENSASCARAGCGADLGYP
jgi:hypothetical protein